MASPSPRRSTEPQGAEYSARVLSEHRAGTGAGSCWVRVSLQDENHRCSILMFQKTLAKLVTLARLRGILTFCLNILIRMVPRTSAGFLLGVWGAATGTRCTTISIRGLGPGSSEHSAPAYRTEQFRCRAFRHYIRVRAHNVAGNAESIRSRTLLRVPKTGEIRRNF